MSRNITATQKYSSSIGKRFMGLYEFMGKDAGGEMIGKAVWHDMHLNQSFDAGEGFEKPPPDLPSGDQGRLPSYLPPSERYRQHYAEIDWSA